MAYRKRYLGGGVIYVVPPEMVLPWRHGETVPGGTDAKTLANRRRYERRKANTVGPKYRLLDIAERDGYRCHICGKRVDMTLSGRHPQGPTADHLLPVSAGGGDESVNVALCHNRCNVKRATGGAAQLRLVG